MSHSKGFITPLIAIVIIIALGIGGYVFLQSKKIRNENLASSSAPTTQSTTPVTPSSTSTIAQNASSTPSTVPADWKTYRNEKYGFKFQYPQEWHIEIGTSLYYSPTLFVGSIVLPYESSNHVLFDINQMKDVPMNDFVKKTCIYSTEVIGVDKISAKLQTCKVSTRSEDGTIYSLPDDTSYYIALGNDHFLIFSLIHHLDRTASSKFSMSNDDYKRILDSLILEK